MTGGPGVDTFADAGGDDNLLESRNIDHGLYGNFYFAGELLGASHDQWLTGTEVEDLLQAGQPIFERATLIGGDNDNLLIVNDDDGSVTVDGIAQPYAVTPWDAQVVLDNRSNFGSAAPEIYVVYTTDGAGADIVIADSGGDTGLDFLEIYGRSGADLVRLEVLNPFTLSEDARVIVGAGNPDVIHYDARIERLIVDTGAGADTVRLDDNRADTEVYLGSGKDTVAIGTVETRDSANGDGVPVVDLANTTPGVTARTQIFGGSGNDEFEINYNKAEIWLYGETGDDLFIINTFLVEKTDLLDPENRPKSRSLVGGLGTNTYDVRTGDNGPATQQALYDYLQSANVNIDGGPGIDTIVINGTPIKDVFVVAKNFVAGAGRFVNFENIERLEVNGADGDDEFYILSTGPNLETVVRGGSGDDEIHMGGDMSGATDPVLRDLPEYLFTPDPILRQDVRPIYQVLSAPSAAQTYSKDNWVTATLTRIEGNTAWYSWYGPAWSTVQTQVRNNTRFSYETQGYGGSLYDIQDPINVAGYAGFTFDNGLTPAEDLNRFIGSRVYLDTKSDAFVKFDDRSWNDHRQLLARSTGDYTVSAFDYYNVADWVYQGYYATTPPKLLLDPRPYEILEDRVSDLNAFAGKLRVDGGADTDKFVVHNEDGTMRTGSLELLYKVQERDANGMLLFEGGSQVYDEENLHHEVTFAGEIAADDDWTLKLNDTPYTVKAVAGDTTQSIANKILGQVNAIGSAYHATLAPPLATVSAPVNGQGTVTIGASVVANSVYSITVEGRTLSYKAEAGDSRDKVASELATVFSNAVSTGFTFTASAGVLTVTKLDSSDFELRADDPRLFVERIVNPLRLEVELLTTNATDREAATRSKLGSALVVGDQVVEAVSVLRGFGQVLTGLTGYHGVEFERFEETQLRLSGEVDRLTFDMDGSIAPSVTNVGNVEVALGGGNDVVSVLATAGAVTLLGGAGNDTVTVGDAGHTLADLGGILDFKGDADRYEVSTADTSALIKVAQITPLGKVLETNVDINAANLGTFFFNYMREDGGTFADADYVFSDAAVFDGTVKTEIDSSTGQLRKELGKLVYLDPLLESLAPADDWRQTEAQHGYQLYSDDSRVVRSLRLGQYVINKSGTLTPKVQTLNAQVPVADLVEIYRRIVNEYYVETVSSGAGTNDQLIIDNRAYGPGVVGQLTSSRFSVVSPATKIDYSEIEDLDLFLGVGADTVAIVSTHRGTTDLDAGGGTDVINVKAISGNTTINGGDQSDTINVGSNAAGVLGDAANNTNGTLDDIGALLSISGNDPTSGSDVLNVDDTGDSVGRTGTLTATTISGLGMDGSIKYDTVETLNISLGSGRDTFNV